MLKHITLYVRECYGCDHGNKYAALNRYILDSGYNLGILSVERIQTSREAREWAEKAKMSGIKGDFMKMLFVDGETQHAELVGYDDWAKNQSLLAETPNDHMFSYTFKAEKAPARKPRARKKTAKLEKDKTTNTSME